MLSGNQPAPVEDLLPLTSLRFIAAFAIVLLHAKLYFTWGWLTYVPGTSVQAVSFFFVLSGFILTHVYSARGVTSYWQFLLARFARLWPLHVLAILLLVSIVHKDSITFDGDGVFNRWFVLGLNLSLVHDAVCRPAVVLGLRFSAFICSCNLNFRKWGGMLEKHWSYVHSSGWVKSVFRSTCCTRF